jgi:hypothetical protein
MKVNSKIVGEKIVDYLTANGPKSRKQLVHSLSHSESMIDASVLALGDRIVSAYFVHEKRNGNLGSKSLFFAIKKEDFAAVEDIGYKFLSYKENKKKVFIIQKQLGQKQILSAVPNDSVVKISKIFSLLKSKYNRDKIDNNAEIISLLRQSKVFCIISKDGRVNSVTRNKNMALNYVNDSNLSLSVICKNKAINLPANKDVPVLRGTSLRSWATYWAAKPKQPDQLIAKKGTQHV